MNWRSTHLKNGANDVVIVPNSSIAKMRIQNHSAGSRRYGETLTVLVDSRNDPELALEILKQAALACPSILEHPAPSADATEFRGDRISYEISFSTSSIASAGEARSQLITQLYKRARPGLSESVSPHDPRQAPTRVIHILSFFSRRTRFFDHLPLLEPLSDAEKAHLNAQISRRHFQAGEQLLAQDQRIESVHFVFSGIIQVTRQVKDGRVLNVRRLGPGDSYGEISLLTGINSSGTYTGFELRAVVRVRPQTSNRS